MNRSGETAKVPDLVGFEAPGARDAALDAGLLPVEVNARHGHADLAVARQQPPAGARRATGSQVRLWYEPKPRPPGPGPEEGGPDGGGGGGGGGGSAPRGPRPLSTAGTK